MANTLQLQISEWTSIEDAATWDCQPGDDIEFRITRDSNFKLFATGAAISAIHRVRSKAAKISIRCEFSFPGAEIHAYAMHQWPGFFLTLGGVALLHAANHVVDASGRDLSSLAFDGMWRQILLKTGGIIGDGKSQSLVSREFDSPIPAAVRSSEANRVPSRKEFELVLGKLGEQLGAGKRFFGSVAEAAISSFLFEAFRNANEHAIPDSEGIWGVLVEKIALQATDEISRRKQIPPVARNFVERGFQKRRAFWICVTVADFGLGIQNTLPSIADESEWSRFIRAFERGTSRKPKSGGPNRGQGLPNIVDAAGRLSACIFVISTGLAAVCDTADPRSAWSPVMIPSGLRGTSISVFWPILDETPDQEFLKLGF